MVKVSESAIKTVNNDKRKWLPRLTKTVLEVGRTIVLYVLVTRTPPGQQQAPNPAYFTGGTWKPRIAPLGDSRLRSLPMAVRAWDVGRSERRAVMVRIRV